MNRLTILFMLLCSTAMAQKKNTTCPATKRPLSPAAYNQWKDIAYKSLTPDGNFAAALITPQDGDGKVVFYQLATLREDSVKRASELQLTFDSKHSIFKIKPEKEKVKELRTQKKK